MELEQIRQSPGLRRENRASPQSQPKPPDRRNQRSRRQGQPASGPETEGEQSDDGPGIEEQDGEGKVGE